MSFLPIYSIWPIDRTLSGATSPGHVGPGSGGSKGVLRIPLSFSIAEALPSDGFEGVLVV